MWPLPSGLYTYRALKEGLNGYDVWVLQLNLTALGYAVGAADGYFGAHTKDGVVNYQKAHFTASTDWDGVAGIRTQQSMCLVSANPAQQKFSIPAGLLRGIMEGESAFELPAVSVVYANGSRDIGAYQENLSNTSLSDETAVGRAFTALGASSRTAERIRGKKNEYRPSVGNDREAWRYAVLYHNWPSAADAYAYKDINTWTYVARYLAGKPGSDDGKLVSTSADGSQTRRYLMNTNAQWVYTASGGRLNTGFGWANEYMDSKTKYVTEWNS